MRSGIGRPLLSQGALGALGSAHAYKCPPPSDGGVWAGTHKGEQRMWSTDQDGHAHGGLAYS